ncbi:hypothetical protein OY671_012011, partial [Metschnikowia pulcherrima]
MSSATSSTSASSACGGGGGGAEVEARPQTLSGTASPSTALTVNSAITSAATASSGLPATYRSTTPETCSVEADTGVITAKAAGPCRIVVAQSGDETYAPAASQTIVFTVMPDPHQLIYFGDAPALM